MTGRPLDAELRRLHLDFATLREDLADVAVLMQELAGSQAAEARDAASHRLGRGAGHLGRGLRAADTQRRRAVTGAEETVGSHPVVGLFVAFGVGFLAALAGGLLRRE
jgi:ElaB/YqjD/DUF883 family membrane-anchored ribosome-binding protein